VRRAGGQVSSRVALVSLFEGKRIKEERADRTNRVVSLLEPNAQRPVDPDWTRWDTYLVSREDVALCLAFAVALTLMRYRVQVRSFFLSFLLLFLSFSFYLLLALHVYIC
jgi:hypothetical protein